MEVLTMRVSADDIFEVANQPEYDDLRVELIEGEIVARGRRGALIGVVLGRVAAEIGNFAHKSGSGEAAVGVGFALERSDFYGDTVRGLDIAVVGKERAHELFTNDVIEGAPDLAVEVLSPSNTVSDMKLKTRQLLDAGAKQVWIVDPELREVDVYTRAGSANYREGDTLLAGDALPGFEIAISDIFP